MARTTITAEILPSSGLETTYTAANADGHAIAWQEGLVLHFKNGDASEKTVTIQTAQTVDGLAVADRAITIPAGEDRFVGNLGSAYRRDADGLIYIDYSAVTSVTVAAFV